MINRILIRTKVVQMLYSYLLTRSEFKIDSAPETTSRDKQYAYAVYLDFLLLLIELSGYSVSNSSRNIPLAVDKKLASNKVAKALSVNDTVRSIVLRGNSRVAEFDDAAQRIHDRIVDSALFADYKKQRIHELVDDVELWCRVFETIIAKDSEVIEILRRNPDFTNNGLAMGVKALTETLRNYGDSRQLLKKANKDLETSLDKAYELYLSMFGLILDITAEQERRIENAKAKLLPTDEDLNPNMRFVDNALAAYLRDSEQLAELMKEYKVVAAPVESPLVKSLLDKIKATEAYQTYMEAPVTDFAADVEFWRQMMRTVILPSDDLAEDLEDRSVFWNDDLSIMGTFVLKTIKQIANGGGAPVKFLPKYKDEEDAAFGPDLFMYAVKNYDLYRSYIDRFINSSQWDPERLAYMDIIIMVTAIAEIINYPAIPVPVSVNEYIEIANTYSSDKSGAFINGILFSVITYLNSEGIINKK